MYTMSFWDATTLHNNITFDQIRTLSLRQKKMGIMDPKRSVAELSN